MKFIDTNIFIRYLTADDPATAVACEALFRGLANGTESATTSEIVIAEVVYVLSSRNVYNLAPDAIQARLKPLLNLPGLHLAERKVLQRSLDLYGLHPFLDFEDALNLAHMEREGITEIVSYDRHFDRMSDVNRLEPDPENLNRNGRKGS